MNQQEEQIKELFQRLKRDDERSAPSFANQWETAVTRGERVAGRRPVLRGALATILLVALAGAGWLYFRQTAGVQVALVPDAPEFIVPPAPRRDSPQKVAFSGNTPSKVTRRRRGRAQALPLGAMISHWRSPTDFLLKTPGPRWLKEVPRLGVPRTEIRPFLIEQKNEMEEL